MQAPETPQTPDQGAQLTDKLPADLHALSELVRTQLARRLILAVVAPPSDAALGLRELADALALFPMARVIYEQPTDELDAFLTRLHSLGPDVVLVGSDDMAAPNAEPWHARVLAIADRIGLCDRSFVALTGSQVTRQAARSAGFEDGFSLETRVEALLPVLVREALARDEFSRHGSSPPCYLT